MSKSTSANGTKINRRRALLLPAAGVGALAASSRGLTGEVLPGHRLLLADLHVGIVERAPLGGSRFAGFERLWLGLGLIQGMLR